MILKTFLVMVCSALVAVHAGRAQTVYTPATGSVERQAIMDVLRVPGEKDLGRKVIFRVPHLKVAGDWAFARVIPLQPGGREIDYSRTKYREEAAEGMFDAEAEALLRRESGKWKLLEWRFGATDTEVDLWLEKYRFPKALLQ